MNPNPHNPIDPPSAHGSVEETLRLIANAPAPAGLEDRVHAALRSTPPKARVLPWPAAYRAIQSNWVRSAAAAAIVFVVAGGGWGVYMRVQQHQPGKVVTMPARIPGQNGFSGAGAIRTPQTLPGPTVAPASPKAPKKPAARPAPAAKGLPNSPNTPALRRTPSK